MSDRGALRLAWSVFAVWLVFVLATVLLRLATRPLPGAAGLDGGDVLWTTITAAFGTVAILILARQPRNRIGWTLMVIGLLLAEPLGAYGEFALGRGLPGGVVSIAIDGPMWAPPIGLLGTVLLLRFPNGELLSPRWKKVEWTALLAISVTVLAILFSPRSLSEEGYPQLANPLGIDALAPVLNVLQAFVLVMPATIVASAASLVIRFRRASGVERMQLKWLTTAAAGVAVAYAAAILVSLQVEWGSPTTPTWIAAIQNAAVVTFILIPIAIGIAILKYRLYDIDVVINKTVVYGALAGFITLVYVGIVVGIGTVIGQGDRPNLGLSILATAVVAVAFQPVRERVQRFANRLVYGKRATPYEVLSQFASRMAGTYATDDLMPQMARVLAEGTGAATAKVWLRVARELRVTSVWPEADGAGFERMELPGGELPPIPNADLAIPVRDRGELLGALSITKGRGEPVTPTEEKLLSDLASQAGLVLRNVRLIEELRASRQRIVSAQDEERRRIERNIHDGAQQQLVALNVKLGLAKTLATRDLNKSEELISQLQSETQDALENLRDLARGIYPPLLRDKGLVAALNAQTRKVSVPVEVQADGVERYPQEIEAGIYFCVLEALQNIAKYARATHVVVRLAAREGELEIEVQDDGVGFDLAAIQRGAGLTNMADRLEALGGSLQIRSVPGSGTTVAGSVPVREIDKAKTPEPVG